MSAKSQDMVVFDQVSKIYGDHQVRALADLNLSIEAGQFVAIMGPSGCGKSTLLNLVGGIDKPSSGTVSLGGQVISLLPDEELTLLRRNKVGFVFQFFNLLSTLTVEENVSLPLQLNAHSRAELQHIPSLIADILTKVGMQSRAKFYPSQLSGGEMQRTAIARALVHSPAVVVADEPTGNLDTENGRVILEMLKSFSNERQQTIIMATHSPEASTFAQRVLYMRDGTIVGEQPRC